MFRHVFLLVFLVASMAHAGAPDFSKGGLTLGLRYGQGALSISSREGPTKGVFPDASGNAPSPGFTLGYNVLGHVSIVADLNLAGWNMFSNDTRGGGGFVGGLVYWHPLESVWLKEKRPVPFDVALGLGGAYALIGQNRVFEAFGFKTEAPFAFDGPAFQTAMQVTFFPMSSVGLGLFGKGYFVDWNKIYSDFANDVYDEAAEGVGSQFWMVGATLELRFES